MHAKRVSLKIEKEISIKRVFKKFEKILTDKKEIFTDGLK